MYYVSKRMEIAGSHKLALSYKSRCENLHGHNWIITVFCKAPELNADGMICDFKHIKDQIHGYLDHGNFNELFSFNPTAENIAKWVTEQIPECYKAQVQGRLAKNIIEMLSKALDNKAEGFAIMMRGKHLCKTMRGVKNDGLMTVTYFTGVFSNDVDLRNEFYSLCDK